MVLGARFAAAQETCQLYFGLDGLRGLLQPKLFRDSVALKAGVAVSRAVSQAPAILRVGFGKKLGPGELLAMAG